VVKGDSTRRMGAESCTPDGGGTARPTDEWIVTKAQERGVHGETWVGHPGRHIEVRVGPRGSGSREKAQALPNRQRMH